MRKKNIVIIAAIGISLTAFSLCIPGARNYLSSVVSAVKDKCKIVQTTTFVKSYRLKQLADSYSIVQAKDGGFAITGRTLNPSELCGYSMFWIKANSNGDKDWSKLYGNCSSEGRAITQLTDGNYVAAGDISDEFITDAEQDVLEAQGDNLVVKIDGKGNPIWTRTVSENSSDSPAKLIPTKSGGFVMSGLTGTLIGQRDNAEVIDIMFLGNFDSNGKTNWLKEIDADEQHAVKFAEQTKDGGYILIGNIKLVNESGQDVPALVKLKPNGDYEWATGLESVPIEIPNLTMNPDGKTLHVGTPNKMHIPFGSFFTAEQTSDGGYIALGNFYSSSLAADELSELAKNADKQLSFVAVKVDSKGKFVWTRTLKLKKYLEDSVIEKTKDGGYIIMGNATAVEDQKMGERIKTYDEMMNKYYKKYPRGTPETPASKRDMEKIADTIEATNAPLEAKNIMLIKTDANFAYQWGKKIGATKNLRGYDIIQTADSGYAIAGTWHTGIKWKTLGSWQEYTEAMIMKLDANGNLGNGNGLVEDFSDTEGSDVSSYIVANSGLNSPKLIQSYLMRNIVRKIRVGDKSGVNTVASEAKKYTVKLCSVAPKADAPGGGTTGGVVVTRTRAQMKYEETKEIEAKSEKGKSIHDEVVPILKNVFDNGVKLWDEDVSGWIAYRFKRLVTKDDIGKIETVLKNIGYSIDRNDNGDFMATRVGRTLNFHFYLGDTNMGRLDIMY